MAVRPSDLRRGAPLALAALGLVAAASATWANRTLASEAGGRLPSPLPELTAVPIEDLPDLPAFLPGPADGEVQRLANPRTEVDPRARVEVLLYTVQEGDALFSIAERFGIRPETVLWGNYDVLNDDPHLLRPGQELNILPVDGTYHEWQPGDTLESVAEFFGVEPAAIVDWPGNHLEGSSPAVAAGTPLIVPGGQRAFRQWVVPTIARGAAGVGAAFGPGGCSGDYSGGAVGGAGFIWPSANHFVSGNDYWSGHLGIDIAAGLGTGVWAADTGVVVFAGWSNGGYGNVVMIDHGNGWLTLYAHLNQVSAGCGESVGQGGGIGSAGSTGNSTGPHLHFETRFQGGWVNPWFVLP